MPYKDIKTQSELVSKEHHTASPGPSAEKSSIDDVEPHTSLLHDTNDQPHRCQHHRFRTITRIQWAIITILSTVAIWLFIDRHAAKYCQSGFPTDYSTFMVCHKHATPDTFPTGDLGSLIRFEERPYKNPIQPRADKKGIEIWWDPDEKKYGGEPSYELDLAWDKLMSGMTSQRASSCHHALVYSHTFSHAEVTFNISGSSPEAQFAIGKTYQYPDGNIEIGFAVYHALHCLVSMALA